MHRVDSSLPTSTAPATTPTAPSLHGWQSSRALTALAVALTVCVTSLHAEDWPQILGPHRNGATSDAIHWGAAGPKTLWQHQVGAGYAGVAVADGLVIGFHRNEDQEMVEAWRADTGAPAWQTAFPATYRGGINSDRGPRCVPVIADGRVFVYGAAGDLHCVALKDGSKQWSRSLAKEYRALDGYFGAGSTPIVSGDLVLVNVGGRAEAGLAALRVKTGETAWKHGDDNASYSSPTLARWNDRSYAVFVTRLHCVAVAPETGKELFRFRFGRTGPTVNAASPLVIGDQLFLSASYGIGAELHRFRGGELTNVWSNDQSMSSQYTTCVHKDGRLYGIHGREDIGTGSLRCIELASGKVLWEQATDIGHVLLCRDKLLVTTVTGKLTLVDASPEKYNALAEHTVGDGVWRAIPAVSDGRIFLRDSEGGKVVCLSAKPQ